MKQNILVTFSGLVGGAVVGLFGGWSSIHTTLFAFCCVDFITGLIVATVFKNSPKTETGGVKSSKMAEGLFRKVMIFVLVAVGHRIDLLFESDYIMAGICIAFIVNELISIIENAGLMGLPIPKVLKKAIDILESKKDDESI